MNSIHKPPKSTRNAIPDPQQELNYALTIHKIDTLRAQVWRTWSGEFLGTFNLDKEMKNKLRNAMGLDASSMENMNFETYDVDGQNIVIPYLQVKILNDVDFLSLEPISSYTKDELVFDYNGDECTVFNKSSLRKYVENAKRENISTPMNPITGVKLSEKILSDIALLPGCKLLLPRHALHSVENPTQNDVWTLMVNVSIRLGQMGFLTIAPEAFWNTWPSTDILLNIQRTIRRNFMMNLEYEDRNLIAPPKGHLPSEERRKRSWEAQAQVTMLTISVASGEYCTQKDHPIRRAALNIVAHSIHSILPSTCP